MAGDYVADLKSCGKPLLNLTHPPFQGSGYAVSDLHVDAGHFGTDSKMQLVRRIVPRTR